MTTVEIRREPFFHYAINVRGRNVLVNYPAMVWEDTGKKPGWIDRWRAIRLLTVFFAERDNERERALVALVKDGTT